MWRLADRQIDELMGSDEAELITGYANPFAMFVIADLLGVPESDHEEFRTALSARTGRGVGSTKSEMPQNPLEWLYDRFSRYIEDRRASPRDDVLTALAATRFPNGDLPEVIDVVRVATNVFAAGQETTVRLLGTALQLIGERPDLQQLLRERRDLIPNFVEETLRMEAPVKGDFRLARCPATVGGVDIPAGVTVMVLNGAANRDPRRFSDPNEFHVGATTPRAPRLRPRRAQLPRRPARPPGDAGEHRATARPHDEHRHLRGAPRAPRRPPLPLHADLHPPWPDPAPPGTHAGQPASL